jgi:hypothetical protein
MEPLDLLMIDPSSLLASQENYAISFGLGKIPPKIC